MCGGVRKKGNAANDLLEISFPRPASVHLQEEQTPWRLRSRREVDAITHVEHDEGAPLGEPRQAGESPCCAASGGTLQPGRARPPQGALLDRRRRQRVDVGRSDRLEGRRVEESCKTTRSKCRPQGGGAGSCSKTPSSRLHPLLPRRARGRNTRRGRSCLRRESAGKPRSRVRASCMTRVIQEPAAGAT